jgi:hypothetical protein
MLKNVIGVQVVVAKAAPHLSGKLLLVLADTCSENAP